MTTPIGVGEIPNLNFLDEDDDFNIEINLLNNKANLSIVLNANNVSVLFAPYIKDIFDSVDLIFLNSKFNEYNLFYIEKF